MSLTQETLDAIKTARATPIADAVAKGFSQSTSQLSGITAFDLGGPAKLLYVAPRMLGNKIPRVVGGMGIQANFKAITAINTAGITGGIGEAQRGANLSQTVAEYSASFRGFGVENFVTFEADMAAQGYDDVKAMAVKQALESLMVIEEKNILFGNTSVALGTTPTPTLTASTSGALAAATQSVICIALTPQGAEQSSVDMGVVDTVTFTSADGSPIVQNGGTAVRSAAASVTTLGASGSIDASVTAVRGAAGYAWYLGAAGSERLVAITTFNSVVLKALNGAGQLASAVATNDLSTNGLVFDGLLTQAFKPNSGAYYKSLDTGVAGTGSTLTSDGAGGIVEIDAALESFYNKRKLSPTHLYVSARDMQNLRKKILSAGSGTPMLRFNVETNQGSVSGGSRLVSYFNPFGAATGVSEISIEVHPFMPAGTMLFYSDRLPYQASNVASICRMLMRRDFYQLDWAIRTRKWEYGVYNDGVLQHFAPFSMGIITNIANG